MANKALQRVLEEKSSAHKEDVAKWQKDNPYREPGHSLKTWKSYSRQRKPSDAYRSGYDKINWSRGN